MGSIRLKQVDISLVRFRRSTIVPLGMVDLPLCLGEMPNRLMRMNTFMVINQSLGYNIIMRSATLNVFLVISSTYHMIVKFLVVEGEGLVRGDQTDTRQCCTVTVKNSCQAYQVMQITLNLKEEQYVQQGELVEKLDDLHLWKKDAKNYYRSAQTVRGERQKLIKLLKSSKVIFTWSHENML